ncbi:hypothetical protein TCON_1016 [Astathelohania contejeani]|uniref:Uncharacterized protein n=1 Tax=Astathelohania contejeani TaxID=164912 RepID=A0ABQ7I040_9MICR|nr:hypothetical protein TCON_1016 [Thelohania contejeani]
MIWVMSKLTGTLDELFSDESREKLHGSNTALFYKSTMEILANHMKQSVKENDIDGYKLLNMYFLVNNNPVKLIKALKSLLIVQLSRKDVDKCYFKTYYSFVHLLDLINNKEQSWENKLNEWLNTNYIIPKGDYKSHAIRGNFKELLEYFPEMKEAMKEINSMERKEWIKKYNIPSELIPIFSGNYVKEDSLNWAERLIYKILHVNKEFAIENIKDPNLYEMLILGRYWEVIDAVSGWLKMVLLFTSPVYAESINNANKVIDYIGRCFYKEDLTVSLFYLKYTQRYDFYIEHIVNNTNTEILIDALQDKNCPAYHSLLLSLCNKLYWNKQYDKLISIMYTQNYNYKFAGDIKPFMDFCLSSPEDIINKLYKFQSEEHIKYIINIYRLGMEGEIPDITFLLESKYNMLYFDRILYYLLKMSDANNDMCYMALGKIMEYEKNGIMIYNRFKKSLLVKLGKNLLF